MEQRKEKYVELHYKVKKKWNTIHENVLHYMYMINFYKEIYFISSFAKPPCCLQRFLQFFEPSEE